MSNAAEIKAWLAGRLPGEWTTDGEPAVTIDREEITVVLTLPGPTLGDDASDAEKAQAATGRVQGWREDTRERRMAVAREAEHRFERKVAWGAAVAGDDAPHLFTHLAVPVMTRLRQPERQVLDTLVEAGVARSRAHALAWCVRLVGDNTQAWLGELRTAMDTVREVREQGPAST
jgi:hypothetical protein